MLFTSFDNVTCYVKKQIRDYRKWGRVRRLDKSRSSCWLYWVLGWLVRCLAVFPFFATVVRSFYILFPPFPVGIFDCTLYTSTCVTCSLFVSNASFVSVLEPLPIYLLFRFQLHSLAQFGVVVSHWCGPSFSLPFICHVCVSLIVHFPVLYFCCCFTYAWSKWRWQCIHTHIYVAYVT